MRLFGFAPNAAEWVPLRLFAALVVLMLLITGFAGAALAQTTTGTITGTITDAQGAAMTGVMVVVHNADTGVDQRPVPTNDSGIYTESLLQPGNYEVTATQTGFATVQSKGIRVQVGQTIRIDVVMPVASQQSLVTVTTEAPLIETEKTAESQNITEGLVANLPVSSRQWQQFVFLTPGVAADGSGGNVSFHGINALYNNNSVDGANNNNQYGGGARGSGDGYVYSGDSIREFQVGSNNFSAEVGQAAGGAVNAVTKSGTSQFHGDLFYYGRAANFNALDPVATYNAAAAPAGTSAAIPSKSVHQQHQWGGSVGGPLIKDKLFFFFTDDGYRKVNPTSVQTSQLIPSISSFGCPQVAKFTSNPGAVTQATMNAECAASLNYVFGKVLGNFPRSLRQDVELVKLDYQANQANHLNVVANVRDFKSPTLITQSGGTSFIQDRFVIANWTMVIGSNKVNELRYQWGKEHTFGEAQPLNFGPQTTLSNLFNYGKAGAFYPQGNSEVRNQVSDNFSFTRGTHSFKTGVDINIVYDNVNSSNTLNGIYTYSGVALPSGVCPTSPTTNTNFCDWVLDLFGVDVGDGKKRVHWSTFSQFKDQRFSGNALNTPAGSDQFTDYDYAAYFQDTWKLRPSMTLNLGLRYDVQVLPPQPNPNNNSPLLQYYTTTQNVDYGGIQPRIGFAWNIAKNTVVRAGMGVFFSKISVSGVSSTHRTSGTREQSFTCAPTVTTSPCGGVSGTGLTYPDLLYNQEIPLTPAFTAPGLPANQQPLTPAVSNPAGDSCLNNSTCAVRGLSPDLLNPRAYEGNVSFERQLPGTLSFTASYIFTRGVHLPGYLDTNIAPSTVTKTYDVLASATALGQPTSFATTVPFFTNRFETTEGAILVQKSVLNSMYNAMVLTIRKPMSHGVEVLANYTLAKASDDGQSSSNGGGETFLGGPTAPDPYNLKGEQGRSSVVAKNRFTASVVWAPTFAKGVSNKVEKAFLDGWQMSGTVTSTNGTPITAMIGSNTVQCSLSIVPTGKKCGDNPSGVDGFQGLDGGLSASVLFTAATPLGGRVTWLPRNSFTLPGTTNIDFRLEKQFSIKERFRIAIRGEAFNLFNSTLVQGESLNAYTYVTPAASTLAAPIPSCWSGSISNTGVNAGNVGPPAGTPSHSNTCLIPLAPFLTPTTTSGLLLGARQLQAGIRFEF